MAVKKNRRYLILNIVAVTLVLLVTVFVAFYFINTDETYAAGEDTIELKVNKVNTISLYAFGSGVELVSSTNNYDIYTVERGSSVRLQAVNETRIFTNWIITKNSDSDENSSVPEFKATDNIINLEIDETTADLDISVDRHNATASDYGKYMMDRFIIADETDLLALQNILDGNGTDVDFAKYYESPASYATDELKEELREDLRNGYFLIANNFTVFNENFKGLGTVDAPFQGVMCGKSNSISSIFITINDIETEGISSYGLFKYLGDKAVVRNLIVSCSIGITKATAELTDNIIYAGGLAGVMDKSTLINVKVSTSVGITSEYAEKICVGGIAGKITSGTGIDSISDVVYEGTEAKWTVTSSKEDSVISAGFVAGEATDAYIKEVDLIVTNQIVDLKNDSLTGEYTDSKLYLGNIFGSYYTLEDNQTLDDIMIMGNNGETLRATTTNGDAVVGGLIGYVNSNNEGILNLGKVYFRTLKTENKFLATTIKTSDVANVYTAGIIGYVDGNNVKALQTFKDRFQTVKVDDENSYVANYLYEGNYSFRAVQNGTSMDSTNGKAIASGIVGKGYIDLSGSAVARSKLVLASTTSTLLIEAVQSKISSTAAVVNDKEHAVASLIYGDLEGKEVSRINVYTNNTTIRAVRESGSKAIGDLHVGGFVGFASGSKFTDIGLYLNDSSILAESLSYEATNSNTDTNSVFCGGFSGELLGNSSLTNFEFAGYDTNELTTVGTTSILESFQNTIPGVGDYKGENYLGGVVGRVQYATLDNCKFKGSTTSEDHIKMSGHESPDSAFCGGIVGLIRTAQNDVPSSVTNCEVSNTEIIGNATCTEYYSNPDIYTGGIIGAAYMHATNSVVEISQCNLINSSVYSIGNEKIATYASGIIAGATWESVVKITNCYVTDSTIQATSSANAEPDNELLVVSAAGILAFKAGNIVEVSHCAVIDTKIDALVKDEFTKFKAYAAGISGYNSGKITIKNCYSNASVSANHENASGTASVYGIAYNASLSTSTKDVTSITQQLTYKSFSLNDYTFEVVSSALGTYRIKNSNNQYLRITSSGNVTTTYSTYNATTFRYENNNLEYNGKKINFDANKNIVYIDNGYDFSNDIKIETSDVSATNEVVCYQSYYLKKNVTNALDDSGATALETGPFSIPTTDHNPYANYNYLYGFDGYGQKLYLEILDNTENFIITNAINQTLSVRAIKTGTALAHVWVNIYEDGGIDSDNQLIIPNHVDKANAAKNGWFILDYVLLYNGEISTITSDLSDIETYYTDSDGKIIDVSSNPNCIETEVVEKVKTFTFKVYDDMFTLNADFAITHFGANYKLLFVDENDNVISDADFKHTYGDIEFTLTEKHTGDTHNDKYHLTFKPNEKIEKDAVVYIRFIGGNNAIAAETKFKLELIANKLTLAGVTYKGNAPINYYEKENIGTVDNPYLLPVNSSSTKFVPIFTKSNDLVSKEYVLEEYVLNCNYSLDESNNFNIDASGSLVVGAELAQIKLKVTYQDTTQEIYIKSVNSFGVEYNINGADFEGLTYGSNDFDFYFEQHIRSNYSGKPSALIINIGNYEYNLTYFPSYYNGINIYEILEDGSISDSPIGEYKDNALGYVIKISKDVITASLNNAVMLADTDNAVISITAEYPSVYTITFELQCETFNDAVEELTRTYKVTGGTSFKEFFSSPIVDGFAVTVKEDILDWVDGARIYGFVFAGFYLVDSANSIQSYGISFEDLSESSYSINSSNTFYGRWSYLIEHIEAPGTYIKTGFNSEFMEEYDGDGSFNRKIQIPINANQGYVFRVDKDSTYQGDVDVKAYISNGTTMTEIEIEHYQNNKNVYYIRPENIKGYVVIMTNVSNSDVIVGEHTSSVTEDITPEDGIITFKYVVNHYKKDGNTSYIYNINNYSTLTKEFVLDFYKQSDHSILKLPDFAEIRVYYQRYIDNTLSATAVGTYITYNDDRVYLSEFKQLDLETDAFFTETYGEMLGTNSNVTEVYYFTITPPNGYSEKVENEMANYVVECGYVSEKTTAQTVNYLEGKRTLTALANSNLDISTYENESAKQEKFFHIVPTRQTTLEYDEETTYTFTDKTTYSVYDITLTNTEKLPDFNYISLYDKIDQDSIVESSVMSFNIKELKLTLGYRLGEVKIYGKTSIDADWQLVNTINVTSAVYQEYTVDFKVGESYPYYAYKIDNISTNEIRVSNIDVTSATNDVVYQGPISSFEATTTENTYSLTHQIVGDARHEGKTFMLAIQLESSSIIENEILESVSIKVDTTEHKVYLNDYLGKNTAYINLSNILAILNVDTIDFTIVIEKANYEIHSVQLLEVSNEFKPSQGEVRVDYTQIEVPEPEDPDTPVENPVLDTISIGGYNNTGFGSGGYNNHQNSNYRDYYPINYLCDTSIIPVYNSSGTLVSGSNTLSSQNKILLQQDKDNPKYFKIVAVSNASDNTAANKLGVTWTHAIASGYSGFDYKDLYNNESKGRNYIGYYLYIEKELEKTTFDKIIDSHIDKTYSTFFDAQIVQYIVPPTTSTIYYDLNGGEFTDTSDYTEYGDLYIAEENLGETITLPTPKKVGYRFLGWYEVGEKVDSSFNVKDCLLVARWEKVTYVVHPSYAGDDDDATFETLALAIATVPEGATIYVKAYQGGYSTATTINKSVTILGDNHGINPVTTSRNTETLFTANLTIAADNVTIDGIAITGSAKIIGSKVSETSEGCKNLTIKNLVFYDSTLASATDAPLYFYPSSSSIEYENIVIDQAKYYETTTNTRRTMMFYGSNINGLTIKNSEFITKVDYDGSIYGSTLIYNDAVKIHGNSKTGYWGIAGNVNITGNYFECFDQFTIWFYDYKEGNYVIENNEFKNCGNDDGTGCPTISFDIYSGDGSGETVINCNYNVTTDCYTLLRLGRSNTTAANHTLTADAHYNIINNPYIAKYSKYYFNNIYTDATINAINNYYTVTPDDKGTNFNGKVTWNCISKDVVNAERELKGYEAIE